MPFGRRVAVVFLFWSLVTAAAGQPAPAPGEQVIKVTAKKFEYSPSVITLRVNVPVVLELTSLDRVHGFAVPDLGLKGEIKPGEVTRIRFTPDKVGTFSFHCDRFCGTGHEDMTGEIVVTK
jgi:cytochrome c oxidase subunit 2